MQTKQVYKIGDNIQLMVELPDNHIDLVVTSPPYDDLRAYGGYSYNLNKIILQLYRIVKSGGVVVWVVNDQVKNGSETGTSFRHALSFIDNGWNLHDTMIYRKLNPPPNAGNRYQQCFEYMFVFSKGKIKTSNIQLRYRKNKCGDKRTFRKKKFSRNSNGEFNENDYHVKEQVPKDNIWEYLVGGGNSTKDKIAFQHPAIFPDKLVKDHILSWSNEGDIIFDPFLGSGTTLKMCKETNRNGIGFELNPEYEPIIKERIGIEISTLDTWASDDSKGCVELY